ncbi:MAG: MoaD/ThiS family protein [Coriobacteriia bacterium]|nr:MoaD/ThiS family protein [Coriobacteriia bacterium]
MPDNTVSVRMFGCLHTLRKERGLPTTADVPIAEAGVTAAGLAEQLDLPLDMIEGVFCNRTVYPMSYPIRPGDRVAFVPKGTPGPHRFYLGLYAAGQEEGASDAPPTDGD